MESFILPHVSSGTCHIVPSQVELSSSTTEAFFLATALGPTSILSQPSVRFNWYRLKELLAIDGLPFIVELCFDRGLLSSLSLSMSSGLQGASWSMWSEADELAKDKQHQDLLERHYGPPPHHFGWGEISAAYDPRGGGSSITIQYQSASPAP
jgi:hypothetical protein